MAFFLRTLPAILLFVTSSCSSLSYHSPGDYFGGSPLGTGTYMEEVTIEPKNGPQIKFNVVFQRKPEATLSSAQAGPKRVFRVLDRYGKEPEIRIFLSELSPQESIIQDFYRAFRPILILDDKPAIPQQLVAERYPDQRPRVLAFPGSSAKLSIESYDWEGHAAKLFVEAPGFTAKVTLREYRAEN